MYSLQVRLVTSGLLTAVQSAYKCLENYNRGIIAGVSISACLISRFRTVLFSARALVRENLIGYLFPLEGM